MKMNSISGIRAYVQDIEKTTRFYENLGFRIGSQTADSVTCYVNWFWVTFMAADSEADPGLLKEAQHSDKGAGQFLCIKVDDIDEFYQGVVAKGMKPEGEPIKRSSGNIEFTLRDPDGYKLVFFFK